VNAKIETLRKNFTGEIIEPGDAQYEQASKTFIGQGAPLLVVRPKTNGDILLAIKFATENSLVISIRSGGHSGAGFGTNKGGIVIDMVHFNTVEVVDQAKGLVRLGSGARWGDVAKQLQKRGLAISSGDTLSVGVGGLTLGAGVGWMVRKYGLAIDSLVAADVVTASGEVLRATESENADLFWAIRGGGGNFGVVTNFEFKAHPVDKVYAGSIVYPKENLADLLKGWRDCMRVAPEELNTMFLIMPSFGGAPPAAMILCCYDGSEKAVAMKAIDPLLQLDKVIRQDIQEKDYADVLEEAHMPPGIRVVTNNTFVQKMSDELIAVIAKYPDQIMQIRSLGGAMNRVDPDATAFAHRDSEVLIVMPTFLPLTASDADIEKALQPWREVSAFGKGGYINFFTEVTDKEVSEAYPKSTYERLTHIKKHYDPQNIFNQNYNIKPE
jgi:hypothetical protein